MGSHALWQVVEIELPQVRNAEFGVRNIRIPHSLLRTRLWGCSSVGRAVALQAIGQEFESPQLHQPTLAGASYDWQASAGV